MYVQTALKSKSIVNPKKYSTEIENFRDRVEVGILIDF